MILAMFKRQFTAAQIGSGRLINTYSAGEMRAMKAPEYREQPWPNANHDESAIDEFMRQRIKQISRIVRHREKRSLYIGYISDAFLGVYRETFMH